MPPESATVSDGWSRHDELLARTYDVTQAGFWATVEVLRRAHFKNPKPVPPPTPLEHTARPVPGPPPRPPAASPDEIRQFFSAHMNPN